MIIENSRRREWRIPFGGEVRGAEIKELILEHSDIRVMLNMREPELKENLYAILLGMEKKANKDPRRQYRDVSRNYEQNKYNSGMFEKANQRQESDIPDIPDWPVPLPAVSDSKLEYSKPTPDSVTGLVWEDQ